MRNTVVVVDHIEQSDASAVGQLVMHEVHRPGVVNLCRHGQRQRFFAYQAMSRLDPQVQFQLAIVPVDALVVPLNPFTLRKYRKHRPKSQLRWLLVRRTRAFSASSLAR